LRLTLIAHTPNPEAMIAAAMLTTTSGAKTSTIYERLQANPEKVNDIVSRLEVQHGSILEHNRLIWILEADEHLVLDTLLKNKFFTFTRLGSGRWLMSANLRAVLEYSGEHGGDLGDSLLNSICAVVPNVNCFVERRRA
jgi:hypothetical protein